MKQAMTYSTAALLNPPIELSSVEKPPVDIVVNAWHTASNRSSPKTLSNAISMMVNAP